jgi:predicted nucleotide-binding protein
MTIMNKSMEFIDEIIGQVQKIEYGNDSQLDLVVKRTEMMIRKLFGDNSHYIKLLKSISFSPIMFSLGGSDEVFVTSFNSGKKNLTNLLNVIKEDISLEITMNENFKRTGVKNSLTNSNIFIVHGQNEEMKLAVARTIEKLGLIPIILHEQPNKGRTIIEKITENSNVLYAIVLLSPDDIAYLKSESSKNAKYRARQNVIFELGYFLGKLGREKVLALYQVVNNFEILSDYSGVLFVPYDENGKWQFELIKELKAIGVDVDANKIL